MYFSFSILRVCVCVTERERERERKREREREIFINVDHTLIFFERIYHPLSLQHHVSMVIVVTLRTAQSLYFGVLK